MNNIQKYIQEQEWVWYLKFKKYLKGNVLKVGNGLGYLSEYMIKDRYTLDILEIKGSAKSMINNNIIIYDGIHFPFEDNSYDTSLIYFVLHHTPNPMIIINEMLRISKRLIIVEETFEGILSKLDLVYRDIYVNSLAKQKSNIMWNSYYKRGELYNMFSSKYKIVHFEEVKNRSYWKELIIIEKY